MSDEVVSNVGIQTNEQTNNTTQSIKCPICGKVAANKFGLRIHIGMMHKSIANKLITNLPVIEKAMEMNMNNVESNVPRNIIYDDWCEYIPILQKAYENKLFVLIIGSKGTGKTTLVRKFAEVVNKPIYSINFSLRTKESHLVGTMLLNNGTTKFAMGIIPQSMSSGGILYLDELNAAEPDVLIRLDEALDDRRELVLKEAGEIVTIKAREDWFVIATINPLSHVGTKELPPQLLSRFPIRLYLDYPPLDIEKRIVRMYVDGVDDMVLDNGIKLAQKLREAAKVQDVYYSPSIRETIAYAKLVKSGVEPKKAAELIFANAYWQWGETETKKVQDLIVSIFGGQS
jgi:nitric oxide reductase NorQ protein